MLRLWCVLLTSLLPSLLKAHSVLPTRLLFTQQEKALYLEATLDPFALSELLRPQNIVLRLSLESLQKASPAIERLLDERLIVAVHTQECPRGAPLSFLLIEGGLVQVKTMYQCKTPLDALLVRCDLFDDAHDPHPIEAVFQLASGVIPFVFTDETPAFRYPIKIPSPTITVTSKEERTSLSWFLLIGIILLSLLGILFRRRGS
jgi:hypothetical protein